MLSASSCNGIKVKCETMLDVRVGVSMKDCEASNEAFLCCCGLSTQNVLRKYVGT